LIATSALTIVLSGTGALGQDKVAPLKAAEGVTAISGRVVDVNGRSLAGIRIIDNATSTVSDASGRFLLAPVVTGPSVVQIDGSEAGSTDYGRYEIRGFAVAGKTTPLEFTSWLSPIDHTHDTTIASPTTSEAIIRTPAIPGLEIRVASNTVIRDAQGKVITELGITSLPPGRQPYALPATIWMPLAFTVQPGVTCLYTPSGGIAYARIFYPNVTKQLPGARVRFWRYEPDANGWRVYGVGRVTANGSQIEPDRNTIITDFDSAECDPNTRSKPAAFTPQASQLRISP